MSSNKKIDENKDVAVTDSGKQTKPKQEKKEKKKSPTLILIQQNLKKIILSAVCVILVLVLCIGVGVQTLSKKYVLKVDGNKVSYDDMLYPIYEKESQYLYYNYLYQSMGYQDGLWGQSYSMIGGSDPNVDSGATVAQGLKQEIIDQEKEYQVLYLEAKKAGYKLSKDDEKTVESKVKKALKGLSWGQKLQLNISKRKLTDRFEKRQLAENYRDDQEKKLDKEVDEAAAIKDISKKDNRQYDIQYYYVSLSKTDDDGNAVKVTDADKKDAQSKLQEVADKAATAKDFTKILGDSKDSDSDSSKSDSSDSKKDEIKAVYGSSSFVEKDTTVSDSSAHTAVLSNKKLISQIKKMNNGDLSEILWDADSKCYVLVKMVKNNSTEAYEKACDDAISSAQSDKYNEWYQKILKKHDVQTNAEVWTPVEIGTVTTDIVTYEDLQKMHEDASSDASSAN